MIDTIFFKIRSPPLNVFHDEIYVHINEKKSVSMRVEEYIYLCSINTSVNYWADYQRQYAYFYSIPATYQRVVIPFFKQPVQTSSQAGPSFGPYTSLLNQTHPHCHHNHHQVHLIAQLLSTSQQLLSYL